MEILELRPGTPIEFSFASTNSDVESNIDEDTGTWATATHGWAQLTILCLSTQSTSLSWLMSISRQRRLPHGICQRSLFASLVLR